MFSIQYETMYFLLHTNKINIQMNYHRTEIYLATLVVSCKRISNFSCIFHIEFNLNISLRNDLFISACVGCLDS